MVSMALWFNCLLNNTSNLWLRNAYLFLVLALKSLHKRNNVLSFRSLGADEDRLLASVCFHNVGCVIRKTSNPSIKISASYSQKRKKQTKRSEQPKFIRKALLTNCTQTDTFCVTEKPSEVTASPLTEMLGWDGSGSTISTKFTGNMPRPFPVVPDIHSALTQLSSITTSPAYTAITI